MKTQPNMKQVSQSDLDTIIETGQRLPAEMVYDPSLLKEGESMAMPVFDGENVVDQAGE